MKKAIQSDNKGETKRVDRFEGKDYDVVEPETELKFEITKQHVAEGKCKDPNKCVIACAIKTAVPLVEAIVIGKTISKLYMARGDVMLRYRTPPYLRKALVGFDYNLEKTGERVWDLRPGNYHLLPVSSWKLGYQAGRKRSPKERKGHPSSSGSYTGKKIPGRVIPRMSVVKVPTSRNKTTDKKEVY